MKHFPALPGILKVERALGNVLGPHIYLGGACVGFYIDDPGAAEVRPTDDVDVVVELASDGDRAALDERIRKAGLQHDLEGPICRWLLEGLKVDVMPSTEDVIGFSNRWYPEAMRGAQMITVEDLEIRIPHVFTFIATKAEAFKGRGKDDFVLSSDFEDMVRVFDGCTFLEAQLATCPPAIMDYLRDTFAAWQTSLDYRQAVEAHLLDDGGAARSRYVRDRISSIFA